MAKRYGVSDREYCATSAVEDVCGQLQDAMNDHGVSCYGLAAMLEPGTERETERKRLAREIEQSIVQGVEESLSLSLLCRIVDALDIVLTIVR